MLSIELGVQPPRRAAGRWIIVVRPSSALTARTMSELGPSPLAAGEANLSVAQARAQIEAALRPIEDTELVPIGQALGRVLARDVVSPIDVPAHDNSAMDGYAFASRALRAGAATELRAVGTIFA